MPSKARTVFVGYPHMNVQENIGFNLKIAGVSRDESRRRVMEAAQILNLTDLLDRRPSQLSGGQRQRVAMGRALVRNPSVFLFDEPLSNLDAKLRVQMRAEIKLLHQKIGITSIYVTHDQIEAMTLADRIVVMEKGRIQQIGSPLDLYCNPANMFVAGFIGSPAMNFLPVTLEAETDGRKAVLPDGQTVVIPPSRKVQDKQRAILGLRPEHLRLGAGHGGLSGRVKVVEPTGAQTHLVVELSQSDTVVVMEGQPSVKVGEEIRLAPKPDEIFLFDVDSGINLAA